MNRSTSARYVLSHGRMRAVVSLFASALAMFAWNSQEDVNVNSRYTIESVNVTARFVSRMNRELRQEVDAVVGKKLDNSLLDRLAARMKTELRVQNVTVRVRRGRQPDHVMVEFDVQGGRRRDFDVDVPKLAYHSRLGWTGVANATTTFGDTAVSFGVVADSDDLTERFAGLRARVEQLAVGTHRLHLKFEYDRYNDAWDPATRLAVERDPAAPALYRTRQVLSPSALILVAPGVSWSFGLEFDQLAPEFAGARTEASNAAVSTVRMHKDWEDFAAMRQAVDASYTFRAGTRAFGSDYAYLRQTSHLRYEWARDRNQLALDFMTGGITGRAPIYERLVLGNAYTLRGWNKYDLDPFGGDRAVHGSVDYQYRFLTVFYDTGVVWNGSTSSGQKHGAGIGFRGQRKESFLLAVAFPIRTGHVDPVLIAGFNF